MVSQNTSHAVMAQRHEANNSLDDFPTPPWAVRSLIEEHLIKENDLRSQTCLEPACGRGHMASTLKEYFKKVDASDVHEYGFGKVEDFIQPKNTTSISVGKYDWIITNPPFRLAEEFLFQSLSIVKVGVALLVRTVFIESVGRYDRIFSAHRPQYVAQFCERVAMVKGRVDPKASTATGYAWIVWLKEPAANTELRWIPPCRKKYEHHSDYDTSFLRADTHQNDVKSAEPSMRDLFGTDG